MLYELLAGRAPYSARSIPEVFAAVLRDEVTPLSSLRAGLPVSMLDLVRKAMAWKPDDRFDSAREMRKALEASYEELLDRPDLAALAELEELLALEDGEDAQIDEEPEEAATPAVLKSGPRSRRAPTRRAAGQ
jgi:serine/threonine protein kinase